MNCPVLELAKIMLKNVLFLGVSLLTFETLTDETDMFCTVLSGNKLKIVLNSGKIFTPETLIGGMAGSTLTGNGT